MRLESELRSLDAEWPPTPDVADRVGARVGAVAHRRLPVRRIAGGALAAALAAAAVAAALPSVRWAVGRLLGIAGNERVERVPRVPRGALLGLGRVVSLPEARRRAGFAVALPRRLGAPDEVRLGGELAPRAVSLLYAGGVVLSEIPGATAVLVVKQVGPGVAVRAVDVAGARGFWISPGPRALILPRREGAPVKRQAVLPGAGILLWDRRGVAYRLEARRPLAEALAVARSVPR